MRRRIRVTAHAVAHKAAQRVINALRQAWGGFGAFGANVRPWKRVAMWVCLGLNLALVFPLAEHGSLIAFIALFGVWSSTNYLHNTRRTQ
jgi:hypothetical protein